MNAVLDGEALRDPKQAGGKAAALARLGGLAPVPPFFVLSPQAFAGDGAVLDAAIAAHLSPLGPGPYAVRSSGAGEDGASLAYAGQFVSLLGVPAIGVAPAARQVWQSAQAAHVMAYRAARTGAAGLDTDTHMAVIVQRQVSPSAAGAAFSADPLSGRRDRVMIAAVPGLADQLMAGEEDGDSYTLDRAGQTLAAKPAGASPVLDEATRARVAALAVACEAAAGAPQDVEWAIEDGILYLLQSRPVTNLPPPPPADDLALTIWDNSNIIESYPGLVSPLTFSFARHTYAHVYDALLRLIGVPAARVTAHRPVLENLLGRIEGRVYYNLLNWYRTLALLPGFALNRGAMEEMMGVGTPLPGAIADRLLPPPAHGLRRLAAWAQLGMVGLRLAVEAVRLPRRVHRFDARVAAALAPSGEPAEAMPLTALAAEYRRIEARLLGRWDAPLVNDLVCMAAFSLSRRMMERWAGPAGLAFHAEFMVGQGGMVSAEPARRIRAMARLAAARPALLARMDRGESPDDPALAGEIAAYLSRFGDRCTEELKLESITLHDDPAPLHRAIAAAAQGPDSPDAQLRPLDVTALFPGRPLRGRVAGLLLGWAKARVRDRENLRLQRTRVFGRVRVLVRAMGGQLARSGVLPQPDDVFHLTVEELLGAIEGGAVSYDLRGLVALRRKEWDRVAALPDLPERIEHLGAAAVGLRSVAAAAAVPRGTEAARTGLGCAPGLVRGVACVVRDARTATLAHGEILVARHTDPGWIALFTNAAAIVVERGSLLSHSAIVARELGIPCVVQLKGALDWLQDGETIEVDGATGRVSRIGAAP